VAYNTSDHEHCIVDSSGAERSANNQNNCADLNSPLATQRIRCPRTESATDSGSSGVDTYQGLADYFVVAKHA